MSAYRIEIVPDELKHKTIVVGPEGFWCDGDSLGNLVAELNRLHDELERAKERAGKDEQGPGEGYRWLKPGEMLEKGDEFFVLGDGWCETEEVGHTIDPRLPYSRYRRKLPAEPPKQEPLPTGGHAVLPDGNGGWINPWAADNDRPLDARPGKEIKIVPPAPCPTCARLKLDLQTVRNALRSIRGYNNETIQEALSESGRTENEREVKE